MVNKAKTKRKVSSSFLDTLKHLLVAHKGNNYHPHIIRWQGLALTAGISLIMHVCYGYVTTGQFAVLGKTTTISISELASKTNDIRKSNKLSALNIDERLNTAAQNKADDMIKNNYWSHESPSGVTPWHWIDQAGYSYDIAGENLAKNYSDSSEVMRAWLASETHKQNILNQKFTSMGFAVSEGVIGAKITTIIVAYYAAPLTTTPISKVSSGAVLGANSYTSYNNPLVYIGGIIKNMSPMTIGLLMLILGLIIVSAISHILREYLPKKIQKSWKKQHGLIKAVSLSVLAAALLIYSGGSSL
jgi:hypothetical protein